jgi:hypothetical protein
MSITAAAAAIVLGFCNLNNSGYSPCQMLNKIEERHAGVGFQLGTGSVLSFVGPITGPQEFTLESVAFNGVGTPATGKCYVVAPTIRCRFRIGAKDHTLDFTTNRP